ncbi:MAG: type II secretion system protein [Longicatena sp.]
MKKTLKKNKKGFTLVEIIVVLVIMGILLAIAVPSVMGYVNKAHDQQYIAQARNGFLGATTIVATENALEKATTVEEGKPDPRTKVNKTTVNKEINEEDLITAMGCSYTDEGNKRTINVCDVTVKGSPNKKIRFTANKDAVMMDGVAVDEAAPK